MLINYKIGMTCRKHGLCDIVHGDVLLCTAKHNYELWESHHYYDLVFYTQNKEEYIK